MNTVQLSKDLSVKQIAAIIKKKKLSSDEKGKLLDLIWDHIYDLSDKDKAVIDERLKLAERDPNRLIPWEEIKLVRIKK